MHSISSPTVGSRGRLDDPGVSPEWKYEVVAEAIFIIYKYFTSQLSVLSCAPLAAVHLVDPVNNLNIIKFIAKVI